MKKDKKTGEKLQPKNLFTIIKREKVITLDLSEFNSTINSDSTLPTLEDIIDQARTETQNKIIPTTSDSSPIKTRSIT